MMESQPLLFDLMLKQGFNWFTLASKDAQVENVCKRKLILQKWHEKSAPYVTSYLDQLGLVYRQTQ